MPADLSEGGPWAALRYCVGLLTLPLVGRQKSGLATRGLHPPGRYFRAHRGTVRRCSPNVANASSVDRRPPTGRSKLLLPPIAKSGKRLLGLRDQCSPQLSNLQRTSSPPIPFVTTRVTAQTAQEAAVARSVPPRSSPREPGSAPEPAVRLRGDGATRHHRSSPSSCHHSGQRSTSAPSASSATLASGAALTAIHSAVGWALAAPARIATNSSWPRSCWER